MISICENEECTGCSACANICPHSAITMVGDGCGYIHPQINYELCVECKLCIQTCPNNAEIELNTPQKAFVAFAKDVREQLSSSSGGMASVLARNIVSNGGIVYGCSANDCWKVKHIRIDSPNDIELLKGSKYVQSSMGYTYRQVKEDLSDNKKVLFIGTPCQVAGLQAFLRKKYDLLYTADLVCHGVPSQKILSDAILSHRSVKSGDPNRVAFRKKYDKDCLYGLFVYNRNSACIIDEPFPKGEYITSYLLGLFYRSSCYQCKYAQKNRVADITLGDYWDEECKYSNIENSTKGLSSFLVNTAKGVAIADSIKDKINMQLVEVESMVCRHNQLQHPFPKHKNRDLFLGLFERYGFKKASKRALHGFYKAQRVNKLRTLSKKIPGLQKLYKELKGERK